MAMEIVWRKIKIADTMINENKVWELTGDVQKEILGKLVEIIRQVAVDLAVFMPETSERIKAQFGEAKITKSEHLFARLT